MSKWTSDSFRDLLRNNGLTIIAEEQMAHGLLFRCEDGEVACVYTSGKVVVQGKNQDRIRALLGQAPAAAVSVGEHVAVKANGNRNIFVVYGHDDASKKALEAMLRRWGLTPLILDQLTSGGQTIIEKLEKVRQDAAFAVVLATPDDEGHRTDHPEEKAFRARQNVVLELGMMLSVLGRDRVAILLKDQVSMERPSDIHGLIYIPFKEEVDEGKLQLAKEIHAKGIPIDLDKI